MLMAFQFGCEWHSGCMLWHFETSRWLWGTVVRHCNWLLSKHEKFVPLVKSKLMMTMMDKEMMNRLRVDVIFVEKAAESMREIEKRGITLFSIDLLSCFGVSPICLMVTQSALDWPTRQEAWAFAMFCWHWGQAGGDGCRRAGVSDVRLSAIIASEAAAVGELHQGRSEETKQLHLLYLDQQLVLVLNMWPVVSLLSRPQVKKVHAVIAEVLKVWSGPSGGSQGGQNQS